MLRFSAPFRVRCVWKATQPITSGISRISTTCTPRNFFHKPPTSTVRSSKFEFDNNKMAAPYDVETYLLDKANIQDTVIQMMHSFDTRATSTLINSVYAPEVFLDYDKRLGGKPEVISREAWAKRLEHMHDPYDSTQHVVQNILTKLPQPTVKKTTPRPDSCTVFAYAHGWFYNLDSDGRPRVMALRNGGKHQLELVRLKDLEEKEENPWRISKQEVRLSWQDKGAE